MLLLVLDKSSPRRVTLEDNSVKAELFAFLEISSLIVSIEFCKKVTEFVVDLRPSSKISTLLERSDNADEEALVSSSWIVLSNLEDIWERLESVSVVTCSKVINLPSELPTLVVKDVTIEAKAESPSALAFSSRAILASVVSLLDV